MHSLGLLATLFAFTADDSSAAPTAPQVRESVQRAIPYLEKDGASWWSSKKCATCHQLPMMFWSLAEAQERGFKVDEKLVGDVRQQVLAKLTDKFPNGGNVRQVTDQNSILLWGMSAGGIDDKTKSLFAKYADLFIQVQKADGSWLDPSLHWKETSSKAKDNGLDPYPPLIESDAVKTIWTLLAGQRVSEDKDAWVRSRDKALAWLSKTPRADSHQELVLRMLVAREFDKADDALSLAKILLAQQNMDGGWSQEVGQASDALATGQALYALRDAKNAGTPAAIVRARSFLLTTQRKEGSWFVPTRNSGKPQASESGYVTSYYGTGWAVLGLVRTLPVD